MRTSEDTSLDEGRKLIGQVFIDDLFKVARVDSKLIMVCPSNERKQALLYGLFIILSTVISTCSVLLFLVSFIPMLLAFAIALFWGGLFYSLYREALVKIRRGWGKGKTILTHLKKIGLLLILLSLSYYASTPIENLVHQEGINNSKNVMDEDLVEYNYFEQREILRLMARNALLIDDNPGYYIIKISLGLAIFFVIGWPFVLAVFYKPKTYNKYIDARKFQLSLPKTETLIQSFEATDDEIDMLETINRIVPEINSTLYLADHKLDNNQQEEAIDLLTELSRTYPDNKKISNVLDKAYSRTTDKRSELQKANADQNEFDRLKFKKNLKKKFGVRAFQLADVSMFELIDWKPMPCINVIIGRNGFGKSYFLRFLLSILQCEQKIVREYCQRPDARAWVKLIVNDEVFTVFLEDNIVNSEIGKIPFLAITDQRFVDKSNTVVNPIDEDVEQWPQGAAYHFLNQKPYEGTIQEFLYTLCISYLRKSDNEKGELFKLLERVIQNLTDIPFAFDRIEDVGRGKFKIMVKTEGSEVPIPIQRVSQGTLSVLSIFGLIYSYLNSFPPDSDNASMPITRRSGLVIIDEIDAHLHPSWQQRIIPMLRSEFPYVQFFITGHNPAIVAGCREGEVSVLKKGGDSDKNKGFVLEQIPDDFIGIETADIYRKVFHVEDTDHTLLDFHSQEMEFSREKINQIKRLEEKENRSFHEEKRFSDLSSELYHINKVRKRLEKQESNDLEQINLQLEAKILGLEKKLNKTAK